MVAEHGESPDVTRLAPRFTTVFLLDVELPDKIIGPCSERLALGLPPDEPAYGFAIDRVSAFTEAKG
jgi:hypothetical protein